MANSYYPSNNLACAIYVGENNQLNGSYYYFINFDIKTNLDDTETIIKRTIVRVSKAYWFPNPMIPDSTLFEKVLPLSTIVVKSGQIKNSN